jgi:hypothetical protein
MKLRRTVQFGPANATRAWLRVLIFWTRPNDCNTFHL